MTSVWTVGGNRSAQFPVLTGTMRADVAVIGAGITGLMTALALSESGRRVIVLEADRIGRGNTGGATGNLYATLSQGLAALRRKWKSDVVGELVRCRQQAVDRIEHTIERFGIDCGFVRCPLHVVVVSDQQQLDALDEEYAACIEAGIEVGLVDRVDALPFTIRRALRIDRQAQFNPVLFCEGLARGLQTTIGVTLHEGSVVRDVDASRGRVLTDDGEVYAGQIVFATHVPKGLNLVQAEMEACREYAIAARLARGRYPQGIFWLRDRQRSIRSYRFQDRDYLIAVGERHKVGHGDAGRGYYDTLAADLKRRFDVESVAYEWSAQQYRPADGLPYIGPSAHGNVYMATGFGADGLVWGTVASRLIAQLVDDKSSTVSDLLTPRRFTPLKSARLWASENSAVVSHLVGDRLGSAGHARLSEIPAGEGRIVELDGRKHAVYRSLENRFTLLSPVCPHMRCHVRWNSAESTWDCPCHGSRFRCDGRVIEGPALAPLEPRGSISGSEGRRPVVPLVPPVRLPIGEAPGRGTVG